MCRFWLFYWTWFTKMKLNSSQPSPCFIRLMFIGYVVIDDKKKKRLKEVSKLSIINHPATLVGVLSTRLGTTELQRYHLMFKDITTWWLQRNCPFIDKLIFNLYSKSTVVAGVVSSDLSWMYNTFLINQTLITTATRSCHNIKSAKWLFLINMSANNTDSSSVNELQLEAVSQGDFGWLRCGWVNWTKT